jgi:hypothetical protein
VKENRIVKSKQNDEVDQIIRDQNRCNDKITNGSGAFQLNKLFRTTQPHLILFPAVNRNRMGIATILQKITMRLSSLLCRFASAIILLSWAVKGVAPANVSRTEGSLDPFYKGERGFAFEHVLTLFT